jgi:plastocyanin
VTREPRNRVVYGIGIPLAAAVFIAAILWAMSRILLAVHPDIAPYVALLFALNILVGSALAAILRGPRAFAFLGTVIVATILAGGIAGAVVGERPIHSLVKEGEHAEAGEATPAASPSPEQDESPAAEESPSPEDTPAPGGATVEISAENLAFDTSELQLPADGATIHFANQDDGQTHNVAIYTEAGGDPLFNGEIITGPAEIDYDVPPIDPGDYYFQCDVHPQMNGSVTVG